MAMKLTNLNIIILFIIFVIHYSLLNGLEKMFFSQLLIPDNYLLRPSEYCINIKDEYKIGCFGMPSGHAEIIAILCYLLYKYKYISLLFLIISISIVCVQRVITQKHTIFQVFIGLIIGILYGELYFKTKLSFYSFFIPILCIIIISIILLIIIDSKIVNTKIPYWVDPKMYDKISEKQNANIIIKMYSIISPSYEQDRFLFMDWNLLEKYLDNIVNKIKGSNVKYDGVVGIKTGGAIISDYISKKLNIPNYKIKVSTIDNNCNKKTIDTFKTYFDLYISKKEKEYIVCEKINENIIKKNIILIDESVASGGTIKRSIDYLIDDKNVSEIFACCIYTNNITDYRNIKIHAESKTNNICLIWPWGYDN